MMEQDLARLTEMAAGAETLRLFLDYDGTLAEFAPTPAVVEPNVELIDLLDRLVAAPGVLPAIISGRRLADIEKLLPIQGLLIGGTYGIEMRLPDGSLRREYPLEEARASVLKVIPLWAKIIAGLEDFTLEDKGWAVALHGRFARAEDVQRVMPAALFEAETILPPAFRLVVGERFLEFAPRAANKKAAVEMVLREWTPQGATILYLGDDARDEEAFEAVLAAGGQAARVLPMGGETLASFRFTSPPEVRAWLAGVLAERK